MPVGLAVAGANRNDVMLLAATFASVLVRRPRPTRRRPQGMCLDNAYDITWVYRLLVDAGFTPHVRGRREEIVQRARGYRARRWVVERTQAHASRIARDPETRPGDLTRSARPAGEGRRTRVWGGRGHPGPSGVRADALRVAPPQIRQSGEHRFVPAH